MKTKILAIAILVSILSFGANLRAITSSPTAVTSALSQNQIETVKFGDTAEAGMLHRAYHILATGDHDYKGHRVKAMDAVKKAADLLGVDLRGDDKDHEKQFLSDDKMRETKGLLEKVLGASEVKSQERIANHINDAIKQIDKALSDR